MDFWIASRSFLLCRTLHHHWRMHGSEQPGCSWAQIDTGTIAHTHTALHPVIRKHRTGREEDGPVNHYFKQGRPGSEGKNHTYSLTRRLWPLLNMHLQVGEGLETGAQETKSGSEGGGGDNKAQEGLWLWKGAELECGWQGHLWLPKLKV